MSVAACAKKIRDCAVVMYQHVGDGICAGSEGAEAVAADPSATKDDRALAAELLKVTMALERTQRDALALSEKAGELLGQSLG